MKSVTRVIAAPPERVWAVLADGWLFPLWVVGATHMRDVDAGWPAPGACLHHSVGTWPLMIKDKTQVVAVEPGRRLVLAAHARPFGTARVELDLAAQPDGTAVTMTEHAISGPARLVPDLVQFAMLAPRNREALDRLDDIVRNREG